MYESEIHNFKWNISPNLKITTIRVPSINKYEAENIINIMKCGLIDETKPIAIIDCTYGIFITKYRRSELFTLEEILVSTTSIDVKKGRWILQIKGTMPINGISIRTKLKTVGKDVVDASRQRMKLIGQQNKKK